MADEDLVTEAQVTAAWAGFADLPADERSQLIDAATQSVIDYCRRRFIKAHYDEYYDGGSGSIWLNQKPVISVDAVSFAGEAVDNSNGDAWTFHPKTGRLILGTAGRQFFPSGFQNVRVQYWAGWDVTPSPVVREIIKRIKTGSEQIGASGIYASERLGDYYYTLNQQSSTTSTGNAGAFGNLLSPYVQDDGPT